MKRTIHIIFSVALLSIIGAGCKKSFNDLYQNPNKPTHVPASLLLNGVLNNMYDAPYGNFEKWNQYYIINYDYYGNNRYDFGSGSDYYNTLKNVLKMEDEAKANGGSSVNPYSALGKFFRAYFFTKMSLQMGDLPMNGALKGLDSVAPAYDSQKNIFIQAFTWLEQANADLSQLITKPDLSNTAEGQILKGDIYFNNDLTKWQKTVNALRIRLLLELSKKVASDPDMQIKEQFSAIVSQPKKYPLMEDMTDNLQYTYIFPTNLYPNNPGNFGFDALRYNSSATFVGLLTQLQDPRLFVTSEPARYQVDSLGKSPVDFSSFIGANPGEDLGDMYIKTNNGRYSVINRKRYYDTYTGEPSIQLGYPELLFNIAEGINRGWVGSGTLGNAEDYYKAGIKASMAFYGIPDSGPFKVYFLHPGASLGTYDSYIVNVDFGNYYNQTSVKYSADPATGLNQILMQKYLALFRHSGLESYYTFRRTGVPTFTTGPGTGNSQRIAMRFKYPSNEKTANSNNYQAALQRQYGGNDDINALMWLLK